MRQLRSITAMRRWRADLSENVVVVPTMGALHHGHAALIRKARKIAGPTGSVCVTIFVNPTQFGPKEDFSAYPRPEAKDLALCGDEGVDAVFLPRVGEIYRPDASVTLQESALSNTLCGKSRPGHFSGVLTIVAKLLMITLPTHAVFGEKDWQQLALIRRMIRDLDIPVEIVGVPTVREKDGLAASSRNAYLTPAERANAPRLHEALKAAASLRTMPAVLRAASKAIASIPGTRIDYIEAVDASTLAPLRNRKTKGRLAAAVFLGKARLIDNIPLPVLR